MSADADLLRLQLGCVLEIGHAINAPVPLANILESVCSAARTFGWESAALVVWADTEAGVKPWRAASGMDPERTALFLADLAARGSEIYAVFEKRDVTSLDGAVSKSGTTSRRRGLAMLIRSMGEPFGVLAVEGPTLPEATATISLDALRMLGDMAAIAVRSSHFADALGTLDSTDLLTHLMNRKGFEDALRREMERAYRGLLPLSIIVADVDRLERVNHASGREAGDTAIRTVAGVLLEGLRQVDIAAHVGSGHFQVLLPGATLDGAREVAERLRCAVAAAKIPGAGTVTATFGVAALNDHAANGAGLMQAAAAALDLGKRRGRNRVSLALPLARR
jgi:diguanylate cyclase (GGDEF)-like protein